MQSVLDRRYDTPPSFFLRLPTALPRWRDRRSLFYLLSNNHVNDMIMFDFRLGDEEVLSHFASFLKTLSLRLNPNTVQVCEGDG